MAPRQSFSERDEAWFEAVYRAHHGALLAYARRRVDDPDDVVSEVFSTAWRSRDRVPDPPLPWLYRTASNYVLHARRADGRRARLHIRASVLATAAPDHAEAVAGRVDTTNRVIGALDCLSAGDRELLRLVAWEELPHEQIAYVLGCSTTALRVRLHRARRRFAAHLDELDRLAGGQANRSISSPSQETTT